MNSFTIDNLTIQTALRQFEEGTSLQEICRSFNIDEETFQEWKIKPISSQEPMDSSSSIPSLRFQELELKVNELKQMLIAQTQVIGIPSLQGTYFIPLRDIVYCKGESSQSSIHTVDGKRHLVNRTLKECESILSLYGFCRIHKSYLINKIHINRLHKGMPKRVLMSSGEQLEVSNGYKDQLLSLLL